MKKFIVFITIVACVVLFFWLNSPRNTDTADEIWRDGHRYWADRAKIGFVYYWAEPHHDSYCPKCNPISKESQ